MSVSDGQNVDAATTNAAFMSRTQNTSTTGDITVGRNVLHSTADGLTAFAGGGQASATAMTKDFNIFSTVASSGDSGKLPSVAAGATICVWNRGANALSIYGQTGDQIDGGAANASVSIPINQGRVFRLRATNQWVSELIPNPALVFPASGTVLSTTQDQTLTGNNTFTQPIRMVEQGSTPSSPASGDKKLYFKSDGKLYKLADDGTETEIGGGTGSGVGGINYAYPSGGTNSYDAESSAGNWTTYDDAAADPVDGTGGTVALTIARTTTSPLRGSGSFLITPNGSALGEGAALAFTIDAADKAKVLSVSFDYALSGTISEGDYRVWIYDVTNAALIQPAPYKLPSGVTGTNYKFQCSFQTSSSSTSYRLLIHQAVVTSVTLKMDNIFIGPEARVYGPAVTDPITATFTGSWVSNTTYTATERRVGAFAEYDVTVAVTGAPTSAALTLTLPRTIDTAKLTNSTAGVSKLGDGTVLDSGTAAYPCEVRYNSSTSVDIVVLDDAVSGANRYGSFGQVTQAVPMTFANGDQVTVKFRVPISGWSSSLEMSSSADTRVVAAVIPFAATSVATSYTDLALGTATKDTHGGASSTQYTVSVPGYYEIGAHLTFGSDTYTSGQFIRLRFAKNGSDDAIIAYAVQPAFTGGAAVFGKTVAYLNAGDTIKWRALNDSGSTSIAVNAPESYGWITKVNGPSQIAASESVNARYTTAAGQSLANNTATLIDFGTKTYASHDGLVTTGASWKFTANTPGKYAVKTSLLLASNAGWNAAEQFYVQLFKNGSLYSQMGDSFASASATMFFGVNGSDTIQLLAGDYIQIYATQTSGGSIALHNDGAYNYVAIERVGNY